MSYMTFRQKCDDCSEEWNAAFGIVGMTQIAAPPKECPKCKSKRISKIADDWKNGRWQLDARKTSVPAAPADGVDSHATLDVRPSRGIVLTSISG